MDFGEKGKKSYYAFFCKFGGDSLFVPDFCLNRKPELPSDRAIRLSEKGILLKVRGFAYISHNARCSCNKRSRRNRNRRNCKCMLGSLPSREEYRLNRQSGMAVFRGSIFVLVSLYASCN